MRYLIDTHLLIWAARGTESLPVKIDDIINDLSHDIYVSIASLWEMAIKKSLRKLDIDDEIFENLESHGYKMLPVEPRHLKILMELPHHHRDPFDRMLIAQSMVEKLTLITSDKTLERYGTKIILA